MTIYLIDCTLHYDCTIDISFTGYGKDDHKFFYLPVTKVRLKVGTGGNVYIPETVTNDDGGSLFKIAINQLESITYMGN